MNKDSLRRTVDQWAEYGDRHDATMLSGRLPIPRMLGPLPSDSFHVFRATEHIPVLGFAEPFVLAVSLAGPTAVGL